MLEPLIGPRAGRAFWALLALGGLALAAMETFVVTRAGTFSVTAVAIVLVLLGAIRAIGISVGLARGRASMPWAFRIASWAVLLVPLTAMGALATPPLLVGVVVVCALDALGGILAPKTTAPRPPSDGFILRNLRVPLLLGVGFAGLAAIHFLWAARVEGGLLIDWAYIALFFAVVLRFTVLPARRAPEEGAFAPAEARRHEPRPRPIPDPGRDAVAAAVAAFRRSGAIEPLLDVVGRFDAPGLRDEARALLARPGTRREDDLAAVADLVEKRLSGRPTLTAKAKVGR